MNVNVMGMLARATVPGRARQRKSALAAAPSNTGLPVLSSTFTCVAAPLFVSNVTSYKPLPVMRRTRASGGYAGLGMLNMKRVEPGGTLTSGCAANSGDPITQSKTIAVTPTWRKGVI